MDDDLESLEAELKELCPVAPTARLQQRIEADLLSRQTAHDRRRWWLAAMALPIAASVALAVFALQSKWTQTIPGPTPANAASLMKPVAAENILCAARDEGVVTLADGTPARRQRLQYFDTIKWQNPQTHASLTWSLPREEVRIVPVHYE